MLMTLHNNRISKIYNVSGSSLKSQFTNLCKCTTSPVLKFMVFKFAVKIAIYKPM